MVRRAGSRAALRWVNIGFSEKTMRERQLDTITIHIQLIAL
jgi:hypothetical protein